MSGIDFKGKEAVWAQFFNMVREECPHCQIENLVVVDGAAWGYTHVRYSKVPPRQARKPAHESEDGFNSDWEWFIRECQELSNGIIPEVHFRDGNPITVFGDKSSGGLTIRPLGGDRAEPRKVPALV